MNGTYRYELFKLMLDEHGLLLSSDELDQIANASIIKSNEHTGEKQDPDHL